MRIHLRLWINQQEKTCCRFTVKSTFLRRWSGFANCITGLPIEELLAGWREGSLLVKVGEREDSAPPTSLLHLIICSNNETHPQLWLLVIIYSICTWKQIKRSLNFRELFTPLSNNLSPPSTTGSAILQCKINNYSVGDYYVNDSLASFLQEKTLQLFLATLAARLYRWACRPGGWSELSLHRSGCFLGRLCYQNREHKCWYLHIEPSQRLQPITAITTGGPNLVWSSFYFFSWDFLCVLSACALLTPRVHNVSSAVPALVYRTLDANRASIEIHITHWI